MPTIRRIVNGFGQGGTALYIQVAEFLRKQITSGEYKPGDCLPTERQISTEFGVSLITIRAACRMLVDEGLISRHSGKGTFVAQKPELITYEASTTLADLYAYGGDVERLAGGKGHETCRECLARRIVPADPRTARLLRIPVKTKVVEFQVRVRVNQAPLGLIVSVVPPPLGRQISKQALEQKALILVLAESYGVRVATAEQWIIASRANKRAAEALDMRTGDPILVIQRAFYASEGIPTHSSVSTFRGDRFRHHVRMS